MALAVVPGNGTSGRACCARVASTYRAQVADWCREAGHDGAPLALIGASLGGLLALAAAVEARAAALVLVNALPPAGVVRRLPDVAPAAVVPWGSRRSLHGTRRAMPDADDAAALYAFRRWRDESGQAIAEAQAGIVVEWPHCPALVVAGEHDDEIPAFASRALAVRLGADFECLPGASHVGPLLGAQASSVAVRVADWLAARQRA